MQHFLLDQERVLQKRKWMTVLNCLGVVSVRQTKNNKYLFGSNSLFPPCKYFGSTAKVCFTQLDVVSKMFSWARLMSLFTWIWVRSSKDDLWLYNSKQIWIFIYESILSTEGGEDLEGEMVLNFKLQDLLQWEERRLVAFLLTGSSSNNSSITEVWGQPPASVDQLLKCCVPLRGNFCKATNRSDKSPRNPLQGEVCFSVVPDTAFCLLAF